MKTRRGRVLIVLSLAALAVIALALTTGGGAGVSAQTTLPTIALTNPVAGLSSPVSITHAGDGSGRLFVVEQGGRIRIVRNGALVATPFLDISPPRILTGGEQGLLGLAFPPGYASKRYFYVYYTNPAGNIVISRFRTSTT
ncbi:MAG TPA: PQQ-dependent sugar dehydrogenase, partial [Pyrinomonadaceae bacterium]|nr:PQQ-dependent sugar dehydrogenase [Pyrinomonadaceae bacterium]